ncbi:MAG: hypothetical protein WCA08_05965, partial [Desulfoferrobacter sp.]
QNFAIYCLQPNAAIPHFSGRHFNKVRGKLLPDENLNLDSIFLRVIPVMCVFYFAHARVIQVGRLIPLAGLALRWFQGRFKQDWSAKMEVLVRLSHFGVG